MQLNLSQCQQTLKQKAKSFAQEFIAPGTRERDENSIFPHKQFSALWESDFSEELFSYLIGGNKNYLNFGLIIEEFAKFDPVFSAILSGPYATTAHLINTYGNREQQNKFLQLGKRPKLSGSIAIYENGNSHLTSKLFTKAEKNGSYFLVNGKKESMLGSGSIEFIIIAAQFHSDGTAPRPTLFLLENPDILEGFQLKKHSDTLGFRSADIADVTFKEVSLKINHLLGSEKQGERMLNDIHNLFRLGVAFVALGLADSAFQKSLNYARSRQQFSQSIADFDAIKIKLAQMATEIKAARNLTYQAAKELNPDVENCSREEIAQAKIFSSNMAMNVANEAIQIHGGYGYIKEYGVERYMREAKLLQIFPQTNENLQLLVAQSML